MAERMIEANGVELCTEAFGEPTDPPILLVMGLGASMLWWDEGFCQKLAERGRFVIRYDHRDTGRSATYEPGNPDYSGTDLVADAAGVLDAYGLPAAHVVGVSAGGAFAQLLALDYADRVLSLVLISSSPATPGDRDLPPPTESSAGSWRGRRSTGRTVTRSSTTSSATPVSSPEVSGRSTKPRARDLVRRDIERARNVASLQNHDVIAARRPVPSGSLHDHRAHTGHPRHRRPDVPTRTRRGARRRDPRRNAAGARQSRPRRRPSRLGHDRSCDRPSHRPSGSVHGTRSGAMSDRPDTAGGRRHRSSVVRSTGLMSTTGVPSRASRGRRRAPVCPPPRRTLHSVQADRVGPIGRPGAEHAPLRARGKCHADGRRGRLGGHDPARSAR